MTTENPAPLPSFRHHISFPAERLAYETELYGFPKEIRQVLCYWGVLFKYRLAFLG